ncbi:MAG: triosephosphate isomerase [Candidatus Levybacteria bacterium]|nr:triosephosphate isomerase [Candidatus Levybacteria bacterium]
MKKTFIVANWKSNFTSSEADFWFQRFKNYDLRIMNKEIIICPSFTLLSEIESVIKNYELGFKIGAQNVSPFDEGAYTGEVSARQIKEFADYVLIGHSERRTNFNENDEILFKKAELSKQHGLAPIFCVQGIETKIPSDIAIVAYEPINAIGTGRPDTAESAQEVAAFFKKNYKVQYVLYGGSVTSENVKKFTQMSNIDGVLVGGASLDAQEFYAIIKNA